MGSGSFGGQHGWRPTGKCSFFVCDIASFTDHARPDRARRHMRQVMYAMLAESFAEAGLPPGECYHEDRGDGVMVILPPDLEVSLLVHPLIDLLRGRLLDHNELASEIARIRLRVALHIGRATADGEGIVSSDLNHAFRLLDAQGFKAAMKDFGAVLGVLASQALYEEVIRDARGLIDPDEFRPLEVVNKETRAIGWLRIPGAAPSGGPGPAQEVVPTDRPPPGRPHAEVRIPGPDLNGRREPGLSELLEIVNLLLDIPLMVTKEGRDGLVESLPWEIRIRIARQSPPHMDGISIVRTCAQYPDGLAQLAMVVQVYAGNTPQVAALREAIARLGEAD